jgi:hypothetical protein
VTPHRTLRSAFEGCASEAGTRGNSSGCTYQALASPHRSPPWAVNSKTIRKTPNTLNATFIFEGKDGKCKMMELEVRHWITNHEAEIGTDATPRHISCSLRRLRTDVASLAAPRANFKQQAIAQRTNDNAGAQYADPRSKHPRRDPTGPPASIALPRIVPPAAS